MPHAVSPGAQVNAVEGHTAAVQQLLEAARRIKPSQTIQPPLTYADLSEDIKAAIPNSDGETPKIEAAQYAAIETAFRSIFYGLVASTPIDDPAFSEIWNLLDIVLIFSDQEWCDPAVEFWLAEELLESQTIDGCQKVFDYLDARRERMIAKHWRQKYLVLLRACTDLLRRLSRAEDTVFCGRVFIYLFQCFPLGDKSAVNSRGEYHIENVTVYDARPPARESANGDPVSMDVEPQESDETKRPDQLPPPPTVQADTEHSLPKENVEEQGEAKASDAPPAPRTLTTDELYPIFWSLQEYFAKPTSLFEPQNLKTFQAGLEATLAKFKEVQQDQDARSGTKSQEEARAGAKRKREDDEENAVSSYNPKYLTNRDLFELEIRDLAFRRHVLVQALILAEFLLAQTPKAKARLQALRNKNVIYDFTLDDAGVEWASRVRAEIAGYLQQGAEGKFYYRMVDTVLARDKNWVHWKAENCPPFQRPAIAPDEFVTVRGEAQRATAPKRLRGAPMGALDLGFLAEQDSAAALERLKDPERSRVPDLQTFERPLADSHFEVDMAKDESAREHAKDARASQQWRALRVASKSRLAAFEPLDDTGQMKALFAASKDPTVQETEDGAAKVPEDTPMESGLQDHAAKDTGGSDAKAGDVSGPAGGVATEPAMAGEDIAT